MRMRLLVLVAAAGVAAAEAGALSDVKVVNDRAPDCSSLKAIVESVTRECKTDDAKAIALYNFCRYACYHHAYPNERGGISALKLINVYGWGLCGGLHTVEAALWEAAGYTWRYRGWRSPGHTTAEAFYGGRWHYLDTFLKFYAWTPAPNFPGGRTIASQEDLKANPALVTDGFVMDQERKVCYHKGNRFDYVGDKVNWTAPAFMVCGDTLPGVLSGVRSSRNAGSPRGWGGIRFDDPGYSTAVNLGVGYSLTLTWDRVDDGWVFRGRKAGPRHTCGDKDYRNCPAIGPILEPYAAKNRARTWSNGTLVFEPDLHFAESLASVEDADNVALRNATLAPRDAAKAASLVVAMASPYVVAKATAEIACEDAKLELSLDRKVWKPVQGSDLTALARGAYRYWLRVTFRKPVTAIAVTSLVQHNQEALPYLAPGRNAITVSSAKPAALGKSRLAVTYAYCTGSRSQPPAGVLERGAEIARAHYATWSDEPVVVQRVVDKLPLRFEVVVPTPKGKQPVYPRMLFLRREVLAPGQKPMPVPAAPSTPQVGPNETLATLPNPWTIGTEKPPSMPKRPTRTTVLPIAKSLYASKSGEVFPHQFVKWLKDNSKAWVLLVAFDTSKLPPPKALASAKLVVYVHESHNRAPMQAAAATLTAAFEAGKPYDFAKLGRVVGSTIVEKGGGPGAPFEPPRRYEIDVTREVRRWANGEPAHGLAIRIVPNRGVDDGWTVRFTPARGKPVELEVAAYVDETR